MSALVKFKIIPSHSILHMFKVFLDNFSGQNVENVALMLEGCGRYLLRSPQTAARMAVMVIMSDFIPLISSYTILLDRADEKEARFDAF